MQTIKVWQEALQRLRELKPDIAKDARDGTGYYETVKAVTSKLKESMPKQAAESLAYSLREVVVGTCRSVYSQELGPDFLTSGFGPSGSPAVKEEVLQPIPRSVRIAYGFPAWGIDGEAAQLASHDSDGELLAEILEEMKPQLTNGVTKEATVDALTAEVKKRYSSKSRRKVTSKELESLTPSIQSMVQIKLKTLEKEG